MAVTNLDLSFLVWSEATDLVAANRLTGSRGLDLYLQDDDGNEINIEINKETAMLLRDELLAMYPVAEEDAHATEV